MLQPRVYSLTKGACKPMVVGKPYACECELDEKMLMGGCTSGR